MNANKVQRKPKQGPKALRVYANPTEEKQIISDAAKRHLSVSKFLLQCWLRDTGRIK